MSRTERPHLSSPARFPRVSGDEPYRLFNVTLGISFSPRERG